VICLAKYQKCKTKLNYYNANLSNEKVFTKLTQPQVKDTTSISASPNLSVILEFRAQLLEVAIYRMKHSRLEITLVQFKQPFTPVTVKKKTALNNQIPSQ
jgi:hypothetical protein